jgi:WD40 repeat protein
MASLFISYSRKDKEAAHRLTEAFKDQDFDLWIDWEDIEPTVDWWREIEKGIEQSDSFLILLSPASVHSSVCKQEIEHASRNGKRLIPVVVQEIQVEEVVPELRHLNWIFLREQDDFQAAFVTLIRAIRTDFAWAQVHRQLQVKALEWERSGKKKDFHLQGEELKDAETQLVANSSKEPHATDLQREYVLKSREASDRQRRRLVYVAVGTAILMAGLAIFGFVQAKLAIDRANIASARQLAAQAQTIHATRNSKQMIAVLLATESMKLFPSTEAAQILLDNAGSHLVTSIQSAGGWSPVVFSPDGRYIVSGLYEGNASLAAVWEAATGKEVARITVGSPIRAAAFSPDGSYVASAACDRFDANTCVQSTTQVWEPASGKEVSRISQGGDVVTLTFSPDGKYVASGGQDGTARVWEAMTGEEVARMAPGPGSHPGAFSPDGKYMVLGGDGTNRVYEALTGEEIAHMTHDGYMFPVAFSPDGQYVMSASMNGSDRVWEVLTGKEVARMAQGPGAQRGAFSPDGKYVVSAGDRTVRVYETLTGKEIARMTHDGSVSSVAFSPDGNFVVSGSDDGTARIWAAMAGWEVARMTHDGGVISVAFSPNGIFVASGSMDYTVRVWAAPHRPEISLPVHYEFSTWDIQNSVRSPDGKWILSFKNEDTKTIAVSEVVTGEEIAHMKHDDQVNSIVFSRDGKYIVSASSDGTALVWEAATGKELSRLNCGQMDASAVAFGPDETYAAVACLDGTIRIWDVFTGKELIPIQGPGYPGLVTFSSDGKYIASGGSDKTARVWEVRTGKEIAHMTHEEPVWSAAFSPDGEYVASGSADNTVILWEAHSGKEVARRTRNNLTYSLAFTSDGKYVVTGTTAIWDDIWLWRPDDLIAEACARSPRNLTRAEWKRYLEDTPYQATCSNLPVPGLPVEPGQYPSRSIPVNSYYLFVIVWAAVIYSLGGWLAYRNVFAPPRAHSLSDPGSTWKHFVTAAGQGGLLIALYTIGITIFSSFVALQSAPSPYIRLLPVLPGLWAGIAYSHFTRDQSGGTRTGIKRILVSSLAGFLSLLLAHALLILVFILRTPPDYFPDNFWSVNVVVTGKLGIVSAVLSAVGASIYIFIVRRRLGR